MKRFCRYDLERECTYHATRTEGCVACIIEEAEKMHPYKVVGNSETYSDYNQGWCDALEYIASRLNID